MPLASKNVKHQHKNIMLSIKVWTQSKTTSTTLQKAAAKGKLYNPPLEYLSPTKRIKTIKKALVAAAENKDHNLCYQLSEKRSSKERTKQVIVSGSNSVKDQWGTAHQSLCACQPKRITSSWVVEKHQWSTAAWCAHTQWPRMTLGMWDKDRMLYFLPIYLLTNCKQTLLPPESLWGPVWLFE